MPTPSTEPYLLEAGPIGVLLIHGFTASPTELRPCADDLYRHGYTALGVRLAGHGSHLDALRQTGWRDWLDSARAEVYRLQGICEKVFVVGLSMGGVIAARLAADCPDQVDGLGLLAPAFRVQTRFLWLAPLLQNMLPDIDKGENSMQYFRERGLFTYPAMPVGALAQLEQLIRSTRPLLPRIRQPTCLFMGRREHTVRPDSAAMLWGAIGAQHKKIGYLPSSGHILSVEPDAPYMMRCLRAFLADHSA